jgi:hypothetical protein
MVPPGPVAFRRAGIGLLGHPAPAGAVRLPHGRPTEPGSDPIGVATLPAREIRPGWVPSILRGCGAHTAGTGTPAVAGRLPAAHPYTQVLLPPSRAWDNGASSRVHSRSPVRSSPLPVAPGWNRSPWASPPGFTPRRYQRRMPKRGRALGHLPGITSPASTGPPQRIHSPRGPSCRTPALSSILEAVWASSLPCLRTAWRTRSAATAPSDQIILDVLPELLRTLGAP